MPSTAETVANAKCFSCLTHNQHLALQTYLLAVLAGTTTSPAILSQLAGCLSCVPPNQIPALQAYLLAVARRQSIDPGTLANDARCNCVPYSVRTYGLAVSAGGSQDPEVLMPLARCFSCLHERTEQVQTYLMGVWAGVDVSTPSGITSALESSAAFTGLPPLAIEGIISYLEGTEFIPTIVILDDGTGTFWKVIVDTSGLVGSESSSGPASPDVILDDGSGGFWKLIVATDGLVGAESNSGPATIPPEIDDGTGQSWRLIVDTSGLVGAMTVP